MGIYSRRGDAARTTLADGTAVSKASARIEACGALDEAASVIGFARTSVEHRLLCDLLDYASQRLCACAAIISDPRSSSEGTSSLTDEDVLTIESAIERLESRTRPLTGFVALKGNESAMRLHLARTAVRRAERRLASLHQSEPVAPSVLAFVNRLSDALFAAARFANVDGGVPEEPWGPDAARPTF